MTLNHDELMRVNLQGKWLTYYRGSYTKKIVDYFKEVMGACFQC